MPKKLGKSASGLFRKTELETTVSSNVAEEAHQGKEPQQPLPAQSIVVTEEATEKVTFLLTPRQTSFLDELCFKVKRDTGYDLARTEVIRAIVRLIMGIELTATVQNEIRELRQRAKSRRAGMLTNEVESILAAAIRESLNTGMKE
jgi:hypothetical protein